MDDETRCWGCGQKRPDDAPGGLCPACLLRAGLEGTGKHAHEVTVSFGPAFSSTFSRLAESLGGLPQVLLRDTDPPSDPGPIVRPASEEMADLAERTMRLQLFGEIARGGMGAVFKARDPDLGRDVAVKVLLDAHRDKPDLVRRFVEEAQIGGQLQHPGIVPIYELGAFADRRPFFAMKLVKGRTLSSLLAERPDPARDLPRFLAVFESICQTMAYAHARGVIHRDLKPSNVMVGSFGEVQVMDWGLAKVLPRGGAADDAHAGMTRPSETVIATARSVTDSDRSQAGSVLGTPSYMAPEQARGEVDRLDERCDVFALGSILCELLTGRPAFTGRSSGEVQGKAARGEVSGAHALLDLCVADAELTALAKSCLSPEPEDRPAHAGEVSDRVRAYQAGVQERLKQAEIARAQEAARAEEATKRARVERDRLRLTVALAASVLGMIILGGGGWVYFARKKATQRAATERVVTASIDRANVQWGRAKAAAVGDLSEWSNALATAREARSALAAGEPDATLRTRVDSLLADLEREQAEATHWAIEAERDRKFLERLELIQFECRDGANRGSEWADSAYYAAFLEFGVNLDNVEPAAVGQYLLRRSVPLELAYYLYDWALQFNYTSDNRNRRARLIEAARCADPDPWRSKVREQLIKRDVELLLRVATDEKELSSQPAVGLLLLASVLGEASFADGQGAAIRRLLKRAWQLRPDSFLVCNELGSCPRYAGQEHEELRLRFRTAALALQPGNAFAHHALANELVTLYHPEAVFSGRANPPSHSERMAEAIAELNEAVRLKPDVGSFHCALGRALFLSDGDSEKAATEYRRAIELIPEAAIWEQRLHRGGLAYHLYNAGRIKEAALEMKEYLRLLRADPRSGGDFSDDEAHLREFERLAELEGRLDAILVGRDVPADIDGKLGVADLCRLKKYFAAAARFYREAFEARPALADDLSSQHRLHAAITAARAGTDPAPARDVPPPDDAERARWRAQALTRLRDERDACATLLSQNDPQRRYLALEALEKLALHPDLTAVRDETRLKKLPKAERDDWRAFWADVAALRIKYPPSSS